MHSPTVGTYRGAVSYERGTLVHEVSYERGTPVQQADSLLVESVSSERGTPVAQFLMREVPLYRRRIRCLSNRRSSSRRLLRKTKRSAHSALCFTVQRALTLHHERPFGSYTKNTPFSTD